MKNNLFLLAIVLLLSGCASSADNGYYDSGSVYHRGADQQNEATMNSVANTVYYVGFASALVLSVISIAR